MSEQCFGFAKTARKATKREPTASSNTSATVRCQGIQTVRGDGQHLSKPGGPGCTRRSATTRKDPANSQSSATHKMPRSGRQQQERRIEPWGAATLPVEPDQNNESDTALRPTPQNTMPRQPRAAPVVRMPRSETHPVAKTHWRTGAAHQDAGFRSSLTVRPRCEPATEQRRQLPASRRTTPKQIKTNFPKKYGAA